MKGKMIFHQNSYIFSRIKLWMSNLAQYMNDCLKYKDFIWIKLNLDNTDTQYAGYYSFKKDGWEICIENDFGDWKIYLCNKWEEVIEEQNVRDKEKAIQKANEFYRKIATLALG